MPYDLRSRNRGNHQLPSLSLSTLPKVRKFEFRTNSKSFRPDSLDHKPSKLNVNTIVKASRVATTEDLAQRRRAPGAVSPSVTKAMYMDESQSSSVLLPASSSKPLARLSDAISQFSNPIEIGRGASGIVYKIEVSLEGRTQHAAVKLFHSREDFEQEKTTYSHLIVHGVRHVIPDVYGYRNWTQARWQREFPTLSAEMPSAGGIFMEWLGPDMMPYYDERVDINPTFIADYLNIIWKLRRAKVYHKDLSLNLVLVGPEKRLVLLDFAYSTLSLSSQELERRWRRLVTGIMSDCV
jgi:hypothetical protein